MAYNWIRDCVECGTSFKARQHNADFCSPNCRSKFNNRRMTRGSILYDLLMLEAADPAALAKNRLAGRADALVTAFLAEDTAKGVKRSYKRPEAARIDTMRFVR